MITTEQGIPKMNATPEEFSSLAGLLALAEWDGLDVAIAWGWADRQDGEYRTFTARFPLLAGASLRALMEWEQESPIETRITCASDTGFVIRGTFSEAIGG